MNSLLLDTVQWKLISLTKAHKLVQCLEETRCSNSGHNGVFSRLKSNEGLSLQKLASMYSLASWEDRSGCASWWSTSAAVMRPIFAPLGCCPSLSCRLCIYMWTQKINERWRSHRDLCSPHSSPVPLDICNVLRSRCAEIWSGKAVVCSPQILSAGSA